jgi:hypothetical protein
MIPPMHLMHPMHPLPSLARVAAQAEGELRAMVATLNAGIEAEVRAVDATLERAIAVAERSFAERTAWLDRLHRDAVRPTLPRGPVTDPSRITAATQTVTQAVIVGETDPAARRAIQELLRRPRPPHPGWN